MTQQKIIGIYAQQKADIDKTIALFGDDPIHAPSIPKLKAIIFNPGPCKSHDFKEARVSVKLPEDISLTTLGEYLNEMTKAISVGAKNLRLENPDAVVHAEISGAHCNGTHLTLVATMHIVRY